MWLALWLWICFAGGAGALFSGDVAVGAAGLAAGAVTLVYLATPDEAGRWLIRAALVCLWILGGLLLWRWTIEDWAVALRIAFVALGGAGLVAYLLYRAGSGDRSLAPSSSLRRSPRK